MNDAEEQEEGNKKRKVCEYSIYHSLRLLNEGYHIQKPASKTSPSKPTSSKRAKAAPKDKKSKETIEEEEDDDDE